MIDVTNRPLLFSLLASLNAERPPLFGQMTVQHMVEHLAFVVSFSNGTRLEKLYFPAEKAALMKAALLGTDREMTVGFKTPLLGDEPPPLAFTDLPTAIGQLETELAQFDQYFAQNRDAQPMHPLLGLLNEDEWQLFHNKHFTHHFKQFGLV